MEAAWDRLQDAVNADAPGATAAFEAFKLARVAYVDYLQAVRSLLVYQIIVPDQLYQNGPHLREWAISLEEEAGKKNEEIRKQYVAL